MDPAGNELPLVRAQVRKVLDASPAYAALGPSERRQFAQNMVKVGAFLARDPGWLDSPAPDDVDPATAEALGPVDDLQKRLAQKPGHVGEEFQAGAMRQGVEEFGNLVETVDFPEFVSGLVQGVFQAIVDASIQQMEAYGELLAATAKTVDEFASDHITDDQARQHVAQRFPGLVRIEPAEDGAGQRLALNEEAEDQRPLQSYARTEETYDFDDQESERKFIARAKLEMARQRQKMMAMMVMLGINRIVVTNGRINAKVVFDIRASDFAKRQARAGMSSRSQTETGAAAATWAPWGAAGGYARHKHTTTVRSSVDDQSESKAEMKAQLSGDVRINFKSETLPPERMLDSLQYEQMNYLAQPGGPPVTPGQQPDNQGRGDNR